MKKEPFETLTHHPKDNTEVRVDPDVVSGQYGTVELSADPDVANKSHSRMAQDVIHQNNQTVIAPNDMPTHNDNIKRHLPKGF